MTGGAYLTTKNQKHYFFGTEGPIDPKQGFIHVCPLYKNLSYNI